MRDTIYRQDVINVLEKLSACEEYGVEVGTDEETYIGKYEAITAISDLPSADRLKHHCAECKFESIDKRCMPCSSCTNHPKNRDAFISCEAEKKRSRR